METYASNLKFEYHQDSNGWKDRYTIEIKSAVVKTARKYESKIQIRFNRNGVYQTYYHTYTYLLPYQIRESPFIILNRSISYLYFDHHDNIRDTPQKLNQMAYRIKRRAARSKNPDEVVARWVSDGRHNNDPVEQGDSSFRQQVR